MSLSEDIAQKLCDSGPADAATLAQLLERDPTVVARMLGKMRAAGRVAIDDDGLASLTAGARAARTHPTRREEPEPIAEVVDEPVPALRCWVYSDGCFGLGRGETVLELSGDELRQLARFVAGVQGLIEAASPAIEHG